MKKLSIYLLLILSQLQKPSLQGFPLVHQQVSPQVGVGICLSQPPFPSPPHTHIQPCVIHTWLLQHCVQTQVGS